LFIVGRFGKTCPPEVLFERESCKGNTPQSAEAWADIANALTEGIGRVGSKGCDDGANLAVTLTSGIGITGNASGRRREDDFNLVITCGAIDAKSHGRGYSVDEAAGGRLIGAPPDSHGMRDFAILPKGLDSARYRALGNAVTVSVIEWIGRRIIHCA